MGAELCASPSVPVPGVQEPWPRRAARTGRVVLECQASLLVVKGATVDAVAPRPVACAHGHAGSACQASQAGHRAAPTNAPMTRVPRPPRRTAHDVAALTAERSHDSVEPARTLGTQALASSARPCPRHAGQRRTARHTHLWPLKWSGFLELLPSPFSPVFGCGQARREQEERARVHAICHSVPVCVAGWCCPRGTAEASERPHTCAQRLEVGHCLGTLRVHVAPRTPIAPVSATCHMRAAGPLRRSASQWPLRCAARAHLRIKQLHHEAARRDGRWGRDRCCALAAPRRVCVEGLEQRGLLRLVQLLWRRRRPPVLQAHGRAKRLAAIVARTSACIPRPGSGPAGAPPSGGRTCAPTAWR